MTEAPLLDIQNLTIAFGDSTVVHGISFQLNRGEVLALVGESGSGKSVTSIAMMGLLPKAGRIRQGRVTHVPTGTPWAAAGHLGQAPLGRGLSMVFQDPMSSLNPSMRVGWQVAESLMVHAGQSKAQARSQVLRLLHEVELPDPERSFEKYPHELSGGQKQRIMIALALAAAPEVLIADEPTTALDTTVQQSILALLRKLQQQRNLAVLFITHDLDVVHDIADRVLVMNKGHLVESGTVNDVLNDPKDPYTRALVAARKLKDHRPQHAATGTLIQAKTLTKTYVIEKNLWGRPKRTFDAVKDVSLSIERGERVGLIGESGSGKSTLGRMLIGMLAPNHGEVQFDGMPVVAADRTTMGTLRRKAQLVFQDPFSALNPKLSVGSALAEVMTHRGLTPREAEIQVAKLLVEVGLEPSDSDKKPDAFSGGQRQRLVIARALAVEPEFLVLDESVAALDVQIQRDILELLAHIGDGRGLTYLFISHDLAVVASFCNRLLIMHEGRLVESGETDEILKNPKSTYTAELLASRPGQRSPVLS